MRLSRITEHLELVAVGCDLAGALASNRVELGRLLNARVPSEWPPELLADALDFFAEQAERGVEDVGWWAWLIISRSDRTLIGSIGFKGPPDTTGRVDIGYGVLDAWQRRGYATEAVADLVGWAFSDARVTRIIGETFLHLVPSIRVLEKSGFRFIGTGVGHEGEPEVMQFELRRGAANRQ